MNVNPVGTLSVHMDRSQIDVIISNDYEIHSLNEDGRFKTEADEFVFVAAKHTDDDLALLSKLISLDTSQFINKYIHIICQKLEHN